MRNYWLKIILGAFAVFAVGMVVVTMIRSASSNIEAIADGTGPITIPLALVPFELDGQRAGTIRRLVIFRDSTQEPTSVEVTIAVSDSAAAARFGSCILAIRQRQTDAGGTSTHPNAFNCLQAADTAGKDLVQFGELRLRDQEGRYALFAPRDQVEELKSKSSERLTASEEAAREAEDSARVARERFADSLTEAADSAHEAAIRAADSARQGLGTGAGRN